MRSICRAADRRNPKFDRLLAGTPGGTRRSGSASRAERPPITAGRVTGPRDARSGPQPNIGAPSAGGGDRLRNAGWYGKLGDRAHGEILPPQHAGKNDERIVGGARAATEILHHGTSNLINRRTGQWPINKTDGERCTTLRARRPWASINDASKQSRTQLQRDQQVGSPVGLHHLSLFPNRTNRTDVPSISPGQWECLIQSASRCASTVSGRPCLVML
jgi:hypothetical protein